MKGAIALGPWDLALAACLVLVAAGISAALRLGLVPKLALASVRTVVQLFLVGLVLDWVFGLDHAAVVIGLMALMGVAAGHAAVGRSERRYKGIYWRAMLTLIATGLCTTLIVTTAIIGVDRWYDPQYLIPLMGMVLGNALTGISLCLDTLLESLDARRDEVEVSLSLGATRWEAAREPVAGAIRRGMVPILNAMMVVGIVSLPGMMTGQILEGADPVNAVKYQIVVMFMLVAATSVGCIAMGLWTFRRMFDAGHRLRSERITHP